MSDDIPHPYTLEVTTCLRPAGHFQWAIRKHGKLVQRSDKPHRSEEEARKRGLGEVETQILGFRQDR